MKPWPIEDVLRALRERMEAQSGAAYGMGVAFAELSRPERYQALGHRSFAELLEALGLSTRMTAYKLVTVVTHFTFAEVSELGGMEKCYHLVRAVKLETPDADPRRVLAPGAHVAGLDVRAASGRALREALRGLRQRPTAEGGSDGATTSPRDAAREAERRAAAVRRSAERLRTALRRADIEGRVRVHHEGGVPCVASHFDAEPAGRLAALVRAGVRAAPPPT